MKETDEEITEEALERYFQNMETVAEHYGARHQLMKLVEELGELQSAISKLILEGTDAAEDHVFEEMGDVENVIDQLAMLCDHGGKIVRGKIYKMDREVKRIKKVGRPLEEMQPDDMGKA